MSHIVSFTINGLAGRTEPLKATLNRDTNVFFGLNGSGKTSLLKILHAAMNNETEIIESVPFESAEVQIYSLNWDKVFTRSIEKRPSQRRGTAKKRHVIHREVRIDKQIVLIKEPTHDDEMHWICTPTSPKDAATTRWRHQYLPTSRLHVSDGPFFSHSERDLRSRPWITEDQLDEVFARSVEGLWSRYSAEVLGSVRTAQEQGLASILRAVLSPQSDRNRRKSKLTSATAYERVHTFLERQGSAAILGKRKHFEDRYESDATLQDVVQDIDSVEDKIKDAMSARDTLQSLITHLFMANKEIRFTDESIQITSHTGEKIGLASLSSGEKHILRILVEALLIGESSLIIDEPEISMHVDWQKDLIRSLRSLNQTAQFIFATHSPEVMADVPDSKIFHI
jgi:predicted ATP-dependent endonuclease of OLD family